MPFDVEGARRAGYSDAEIADHLAQQAKFDAPKARQSGYTDAEIVRHLSDKAAQAERGKGLLAKAGDAITNAVAAPFGADMATAARVIANPAMAATSFAVDRLAGSARSGTFASDAAKDEGYIDRAGSLLERGSANVVAGLHSTVAGLTGSRRARAEADNLNKGTVNQKVAGQTSWQDVKDRPGIDTLGKYVLDASTESLPGMAVAAIPVAGVGTYAASNAGNIADQRAQNDGRSEASAGDVFAAAPAAIASAYLERVGPRIAATIPGKSIASGIGRAALAEAGTEALQSSVEYAGGTIGTQKGFSAAEMGDQALAGAVAGAGMGGAIRASADGYRGVVRLGGRFNQRPIAPGIRAEASQAAAIPTPEDIASPIPTDLIMAGKVDVSDAGAKSAADDILAAAGMPATGTRVSVTMPDGQTHTGSVRDAFHTDAGEMGSASGIAINMDDGTIFTDHFDTLAEAGVKIHEAPAFEQSAEAKAIDAQLAEQASATVAAPADAAPTALGLNTHTRNADDQQGSDGFDLNRYMGRSRHAESGGSDSAKAVTSSAYGRYQFLKDTWLATYKQTFGETGESKDAILAKRADGAVQDKVMATFTNSNAAALRRAGVPVNDGSVYLAHFLGVRDAIKVLKAAPGAAIDGIVSDSSIAANPAVFSKTPTAGALTDWASQKMGSAPVGGSSASSAEAFDPNTRNGDRSVLDSNTGSSSYLDQAMRRVAGDPIDSEWSRFADTSGTLGVPRDDMPQIKAEHRGAMVNFLNARGIAHEEQSVPASDLKPTQAEFSNAKVRKAIDFEGGNRAILTSSDGYVLDGHHQWIAALSKGEDVRTIKLDAPIAELLKVVPEFPSATDAQGSTDTKPVEIPAQGSAQAAAPEPQGTAAQSSETGTGAAAPAATVEDFTDKSVIVRGLDNSEASKAAVAAGLPAKGVPLWNAKAGGWVVSKKHAEKVRAALDSKSRDSAREERSTLRRPLTGKMPETLDEAYQTLRDMRNAPKLDEYDSSHNHAAHALSILKERGQEASSRMAANTLSTDQRLNAHEQRAFEIIRDAAPGTEPAKVTRPDIKIAEAAQQTPVGEPVSNSQELTIAPTLVGGMDVAAAAKVAKDRDQASKPDQIAKPAEKVASETLKPATAPEPSSKTGQFAGNKIFTEDKVAAARARLQAKLNAGRLNSGLDPELLMDGVVLAGAHIEAGVRKFADLARTLADDLGTDLAALKPYLRAWYNGARDMLEDSGEDVADMDGPGAVKAALTMIEDQATKPAESAKPPTETENAGTAIYPNGAGSLETVASDNVPGSASQRPTERAGATGQQGSSRADREADGTGLSEARGRGSRSTGPDQGVTGGGRRVKRRDDQAAPQSESSASPADVRDNDVPVRGRGETRALGIADRIRTGETAALVGALVTHPSELAELAQVYRDPRHETFRVFFTKGSSIVHATGVSSRQSDEAPLLPNSDDPSEFHDWLAETMASAGADGFYLLHNHPSGDPTPSPADKKVTAAVADKVPGFKGHVVINSNKYAVIDARGDGKTFNLDLGDDALLKPSKPHPVLGEVVLNADALARMGKAVQRDGYVTIVGTNRGKVRVAVDYPIEHLSRASIILMGALRRIQRISGSSALFIIGDRSVIDNEQVHTAYAKGLLTDGIDTAGRFLSQTAPNPPPKGGSALPKAYTGAGRFVAEDGPVYRSEAARFDDRDTEDRFQAARAGMATTQTLRERVSETWEKAWNGISRHWIALPNEPRYAALQEKLRGIESAPQAARERTVAMLDDMVKDFTNEDLDLFTRKVILDDLSWDAANERDLPFGFTMETLTREKSKVDSLVMAQPDQKVWKAAMKRKLANRKVAQELVDAGVLEAEQIKNPSYYRHQVLEYARAQMQYAKTPGKKLRTPKWAKRMGSTLDINANLLEAEFDWLNKAFVDIPVAKTIEWIKKSEHNILEDLKSEAKSGNQSGVDAKLAEAEDVLDDSQSADDEKERAQSLIDQARGFRKSIAMGFGHIRAAIDDGSLDDMPAKFRKAAEAIQTGDTAGDPPFALLSWMLDTDQPGAMGAAMILKAIGQRRAWTKNLLGRDYVDPDNAEELVKRLAPDGYRTWQPDEGKLLFTVKTLPEHVIDGMLDKLDAPEGIDPAVFRAALEGSRNTLAVGGQRYTMILPDEVADTLSMLRREEVEGLYKHFVKEPVRLWKRWVLVNPRRFLKYNLNNITGDLDAVLAGNPKLLRHVGKAGRELADVMRGKARPSDRYQEAVARGVFDSGLSIQEIPDINQLAPFERFAEKKGKIDKYTTMPLRKAWNALQGSTQWRENVFRYAAYLDYADRLEGGESQSSVGYGASRPNMVDAVPDLKDRAALLSRDLLGDYGAISHYGSSLRQTVIPFWSWMEINTRRYWRLTGNAYSQGIGKGLAVGGGMAISAGARTTAYLAIRMALVYGLLSLWNGLFFPDEEDELGEAQRQQMHLILGRNDNGEIITLRTQGAMSDALSWFGLGNVVRAARDYEMGRGSLSSVLTAPLKATVNKLGTAVSPIITVPVEATTGKKLWPDVFNSRSNRDPWRNVFSTVSLENEYDLAMGKPSRGYARSWQEAAIYRKDPGEIAYDEARGAAYDWLKREKGQEFAGGFTSKRSEAARDYRTALKFGDQESADKALNEMIALGVDSGDFSAMVKRAAPLGPIAKKDRQAFIDQLTPDEYQTFQRAQRWYDETFLSVGSSQ